MKIINRTPHDITMLNEDKEMGHPLTVLRVFPKSDEPIRLESSQVVVDCVSGGIYLYDVKQVVYGESNLPDYEEGVYYIVSALVANAYPERKDLLMVNDTVRDDNGRIIGCKSFAVVASYTTFDAEGKLEW